MRAIGVLVLLGMLVVITGCGTQIAYRIEEVSLGAMLSDKTKVAITKNSWRIAFVVTKGDKQFVVLDGQAGPEYEQTRDLNFSPDGEQLAYIAWTGDKDFVVLDGRKGREYEDVWELLFSRDGKRLAYVARRDGKSFVVLDDQEGPGFDAIWMWNLQFSPDGKRVAYVAERDSKVFIVLDGQEGPKYDSVIGGGGPAFRPDGTLEYLAVKAGTLFRVKHVPVEDSSKFEFQVPSERYAAGKPAKIVDCGLRIGG
jgi:WD40 repeat protein